MDKYDGELQHSIYKTPSFSGGALGIRLFYVRIAPCAVENLPEHLTLYYLRRESGVFLEINGARIPSSDAVSITLRRDRVDKDCSDVTYINTDSVRFSGPLEFEVYEEGKNMDLILCGSLQRVDAAAVENDSKSGWSMDCYASNCRSAFFRRSIGITSPSIEVYVAGCCSRNRIPVILTETILVTPRRKALRKGMLDAIPENEEIGKNQRSLIDGSVRPQSLQVLCHFYSFKLLVSDYIACYLAYGRVCEYMFMLIYSITRISSVVHDI